MIKVSASNKGVIHHAPTEHNDKGIGEQQGRDQSHPYEAQ
jgi:hypothetical protein